MKENKMANFVELDAFAELIKSLSESQKIAVLDILRGTEILTAAK